MTHPQPHMEKPKYRPDVDGLRAVAVLGVVAFHAFPAWMTGGFAGVDVFFVISGFLISTIIFENLDSGLFSFGDFYARRIRRIFPALLLVLLACLVFGWLSLLAEEYRQLGKHIAAGAGFVPNLVLWSEHGYFDNAAETKPLLHLWSLGIEEQFYLVWPFLIWIAWRWRFSILHLMILASLISFALNVSAVERDPVATFFSPHTRFWELLSGSTLAWILLYHKEAWQVFRQRVDAYLINAFPLPRPESFGSPLANTLSCLGLSMLGFGFWALNEDMNFPGVWASVPVAASVLILLAGPDAWFNRIVLSNRLAVWFGLISYPLYLWHWPLLSFARIIEGEAPDREVRITAVIISVLLAWMTFKFVETPIRMGKYTLRRIALLVAFMFATGVAGYIVYAEDGVPHRENAALTDGYVGDIGQLEFHRYVARNYFVCTPDIVAKEALKFENYIRCMQSKDSNDIDVALVGDSHAEHLFIGMSQALPDKNVVFYIKNSAPFQGNSDFKKIFDVIETSESLKQIIIAMNWRRRIPEVAPDSSLEREIIKVVDRFRKAGKEVYLLDDVPVFNFPPDRCKGKRWLASKNPGCEISLVSFERQKNAYTPALRNIAESRPQLDVINIGEYLCDNEKCSMVRGNEILYRDNNHLNINGSQYVGARIVEENPRLFH